MLSRVKGTSRSVAFAFSMRSGWRTNSTGDLTVLVMFAGA